MFRSIGNDASPSVAAIPQLANGLWSVAECAQPLASGCGVVASIVGGTPSSHHLDPVMVFRSSLICSVHCCSSLLHGIFIKHVFKHGFYASLDV